ncbi:hypothetical protein [Flavobacterium sp. UBA4854]|uniref:hypothetical protein n=1 Tax=Flavobacterium sp. UBA4854 TaxID=1946548 RepID=UPI00258001F7|nr:hypothetical protein [Flavobacterium sp. UBA4854]
MDETNELRCTIEEKEVSLQKHFSLYQKNLRKYPFYLKYDAFKDLKLIFELYSEIFHLRGYNYSKFTDEKLIKLIKPFSDNEKKELIGHLIKSLVKNGNDDEAKNMILLLNKLEIKCYWNSICKFQNVLSNLLKLTLKALSFNIWIVLMFIAIYLIISTTIFCEASFDLMTVLEVKKIKVSDVNWINNLGNLFTYIFELDERMQVTPLNFLGVLVLVFQKSFLLLVIGNYLIKEIFNKIKLQ